MVQFCFSPEDQNHISHVTLAPYGCPSPINHSPKVSKHRLIVLAWIYILIRNCKIMTFIPLIRNCKIMIFIPLHLAGILQALCCQLELFAYLEIEFLPKDIRCTFLSVTQCQNKTLVLAASNEFLLSVFFLSITMDS